MNFDPSHTTSDARRDLIARDADPLQKLPSFGAARDPIPIPPAKHVALTEGIVGILAAIALFTILNWSTSVASHDARARNAGQPDRHAAR